MPHLHRFARNSIWMLPGLVAAALYFQVWDHIYIEFDDMYYTYESPMVVRGLTWEGLVWAFEDSHVANYHPLTWLSHMLDFELFGNRPGIFALENGAIHGLNSILVAVLFAVLFKSKSLGIVVGIVFAAHPKLVEAVAWISQRKTLLSTFFALGTMILYLRSLNEDRRVTRPALYASALGLYILSLLAKGMYVTMPAVLLILEIVERERRAMIGASPPPHPTDEPYQLTWPNIRGMLVRLSPFAVLGLLFSALTFWAQAGDEAVQSFEVIPFSDRLTTATVGLMTYLKHFVYPVGLSVFYPRPETWSLGTVIGSSGLLLLISIGLAALRNVAGRTAFLGWVLFLGMLLPVIGIIQVGDQASADRYMYGPILGLLIVAACLLPLAWSRTERVGIQRLIVGAVAAWTCFACVATFRQVSYWTDSYSLALASEAGVGPHPQLLTIRGTILSRAKRYDQAIPLYRKVLEILPTHPTALQNLAVAEFAVGNSEEAVRLCRLHINLDPTNSGSYTNLALFLTKMGRDDEARAAIVSARARRSLAMSEINFLNSIEAELDQRMSQTHGSNGRDRTEP